MPERSTVVLVDERGAPTGRAAKREAHEPPGTRHLAFSVFLFSTDGRLLVQRRATRKYHFPGIWANSCCSHPGPDEDLVSSAARRVREELGIVLTAPLADVGTFEYRAVDPASGLVEHEVDHVLVGSIPSPAAGSPAPPPVDPDEIDATRWVAVDDVRGAGPEQGWAPWFAEALEIALAAGPPRR